MVNTKIRLIIFYAAKDGEAVYSQQKQDQELTVAQIMNSALYSQLKQDWELTVAQIMNSLLPNSDLNFFLKLKKVGKTTRPFNHLT